MNTPERLSQVQEKEPRAEATVPSSERRIAHRPEARTVTRFEIGVFFRKVVDGLIVRYIQVPRSNQPLSGSELSGAQEGATGGAESQARSLQAISLPAPGEQSNTTDEDDAGPIKSSTSYEAGVFLRRSTESTDDESA